VRCVVRRSTSAPRRISPAGRRANTLTLSNKCRPCSDTLWLGLRGRVKELVHAQAGGGGCGDKERGYRT
jgi:hypothetical protein